MAFRDEVVYALILGFSIAAGLFIRTITSVRNKQAVAACFGFVTTFALCGWETLHSLVAVLSTILIIKSRSRQTPLIAFVVIFTLLLIYRGSELFGLGAPSAVGNAVQLVLTLKLISVAIEVHDFRRKLLQKEKPEPQAKFQLSLDEEPTIYDLICYSYCYVGLFTGPFFKYRTYHDFLQQKENQLQRITWKDEVENRVRQVVVFAVLYLVASQFFSVDHVKSDAFYERSFWYRLLYMVPIFFIARMRFYVAWLLSECAYVTSGLGAYPECTKPRSGHGPTVEHEYLQLCIQGSDESMEYNFETVRNINPYGSDWSKTVRDGMRNWNMSVQWWLATYVHRRWPSHLKQFRTAAVLGVSAYWHGLAAGYFGAFLTMPFIMLAEDLMVGTVKNRLPEKYHNNYDWVNWFFKMRSFEYMFMAFALLSWEDTYRWWKSVYFIGHILCFLTIAGCVMSKKFLKRKETHPKAE